MAMKDLEIRMDRFQLSLRMIMMYSSVLMFLDIAIANLIWK